MKNLLKMQQRKELTANDVAEHAPRNTYESEHHHFICHKVGNYWWRLTQSQWADHFRVPRSTFEYRIKHKYPMDTCTGITK